MTQQPPWPPQRPQYPQQPNAQSQWSQPQPQQQYGVPPASNYIPPQQPAPQYGQSQQTQYGPPSHGYYIPPQQQLQQSQWSPQQSPRQMTNKQISGIVIVSIAVLVFVMLLYGQHNPNPSTSSSTNISTANPANVGDTIMIDGISCTVLSVQGSSNSLEPGYVLVHIKLVNNSSNEFHYFVSDFHIKTDSGSIIDADSEASELQLISGALAPGGSVDGNVAFGLFDDHNTEMIWQPEGHSDDLSHIWNLGL